MKMLLAVTSVMLLVVSSRCTVTAQQFTDVSADVGLVAQPQHSWGNPIWGDINNDGYLDLIIPCHGLHSSGGPFVYLNNAGHSFTDIRSTCGIQMAPELDSTDWHGYGFGDYDQDGNLDVYIAEGAKGHSGGTTKRDLLFKGHGDGTFSYVSAAAGLETSMNRGRCPFWFDYDNNGTLDLFVKNFSGKNVLYRGKGDGTLVPVEGAGGLAEATVNDVGSIVSCADYDNDGFMDIAIAGENSSQQLYHNQGDGTFVNVTSSSGIGSDERGKGIAWGDYDNDGFVDLFIARAYDGNTIQATSLYHNNGDGTFTDVTDAAGVRVNGACWTGVWGDYDNDGFLDLFVPNAGTTGEGPGDANLLFHNNGDGTFTNVAAAAGVELKNGTALHRAAAWADYNNDGFLDLLLKDGSGSEKHQGPAAKGLHFLFKNKGNNNHFIKITLRGTQSNLAGIGARAKVSSSNGESYRQNNGGGGGESASQGSEPLHFGIGHAAVASVEVRWPSGVVDTLSGVQADTSLTLVEGSTNAHAPVITKQPRNRHVEVGERARFTVTVTGDEPLTFQWAKNGHDIPGAHRANYSTPPVAASDDGSTFSVTVTNADGSVTSRDAKLFVAGTP